MTTKNLTVPKSIGRQLNFTAGAASAVCSKMLEPHDLSLAQWAVLMALWRNGPLSIKDLSDITGNAAPAASRIVDRMVKNGLLSRSQATDDRRAVTIELTEKSEGLKHLEGIYERVNEVALAGLSASEVEQLFMLLARVEVNGRKWLKS